MRRWLPLVGGMSAFTVAVLAIVLYLVFSGTAGKTRGVVIINLRSEPVVLTLDDGQSANFKPGEAQTVIAKKKDFPQSARVTDANGKPLFAEQLEYKQLSDAEFRIAIGESGIVFPVKPAGSGEGP